MAGERQVTPAEIRAFLEQLPEDELEWILKLPAPEQAFVIALMAEFPGARLEP